MNEQINKLVNQSKRLPYEHNVSLESFAELLISECVSEIEKNYVGQVGTHASAHNSAIKKSVDSIKHLYGVTE